MGTTTPTPKTKPKNVKEELKHFYLNFAFKPRTRQGISDKETLERMRDCLTVVIEARTYQGATVKGRQIQLRYSSWQASWELTDCYWVPAASSHGAVRHPVRIRPATRSTNWSLVRDSNQTED